MMRAALVPSWRDLVVVLQDRKKNIITDVFFSLP
jgi:hypothetical protein